MRVLFSILLLFTSPVLFAQITLDQQVMSSFYFNAQGSMDISSTGGQIENTKAEYSNGILTQGFEQGNLKKLDIVYLIESPECDNGDPYQISIPLDSVCYQGSGQIFLDGYEEDELVLIDQPGSFLLDIICDNGANYSDSIIILDIVLPGCNLEFYNVITPAHQLGYWHIDNIDSEGFEVNKVTIFNRWAGIVWEGDNYDNMDISWTGIDLEGTILPQGTYYYVVEVNQEIFTGFIELIR